MDENQTECSRCGSCCANGGPALHIQDKELIEGGAIPISHLITIRKGELVHNPVTNSLQAAKNELIKINGVGKEWSCFYFDPDQKGCIIYDRRPLACQALECWDTEAVEQIIEKDLLSRADLIKEDDPLYQAVAEHELNFPCPDLESIIKLGCPSQSRELEDAANREVVFRTELVSTHGLSLGDELFYFGRPLFHLLISVGARVRESTGRLLVDWPSR
ncbi:MAG: YkgJ family cysteine cluster protein [Desulfofustis sp.]|nr:YkgJ family cysteine cluster protein [Desulfofustis sp.]